MNRTRLYLELLAAVLFAGVLYVFLPVLRSRAVSTWTPNPQAQNAAPLTVQPPPTKAIRAAREVVSAQGRTAKPSPKVEGIADLPNQSQPTVGFLEQRANGRFSETFMVMAGSNLHVSNQIYDHIEIRATYPVSVQVGTCRNDNTVDVECETEPTEISVSDTRKGANPKGEPANSIQVIARDSTFIDPHPQDFTIKAGSTLRIRNSTCRDIKVHSPNFLSISSGNCSDVAAFDFECKSENPTDLVLTDHRSRNEGSLAVTVSCGDLKH